ncbi:MAG: 30S ribosome-binding factor RbfA [Alphaproteobacteria bacterium]|nr:30S ribosome-binding factor RbfA [Alphaproteobacteria bacterium]
MRLSKSSARSKPDRVGASPRQLKVGEEIRHALAAVLSHGDLRDPALHGRSITVSEVAISPDLKHATAYVMPLGGADLEAVLKGLERAGPFLRREVSRNVRLRYMPDLTFEPDVGFARAERIDRLLHDIPPPTHGS